MSGLRGHRLGEVHLQLVTFCVKAIPSNRIQIPVLQRIPAADIGNGLIK
jgi:hypothetical protein